MLIFGEVGFREARFSEHRFRDNSRSDRRLEKMATARMLTNLWRSTLELILNFSRATARGARTKRGLFGSLACRRLQTAFLKRRPR